MERLRITVNGRSYEVLVEVLGTDEEVKPARPEQRVAAVQPAPPVDNMEKTAAASPPPPAPVSAGAKQYTAPLPGKVMAVKVAKGDPVCKGQPLLILETMKMENELTAPWDCVVEAVHVSEGQTVQAGDLLITAG